MSIRVMSWVWDHSLSTGVDRLVLLAIADAANDSGGQAWPSRLTLAKKTRVDEKTVRRAIVRLTEMGELKVRQRAGQGNANIYQIIMTGAERPPKGGRAPGAERPPNGGGAPGGAERPGAESPGKGGRAPHNPSLNRPKDSLRSSPTKPPTGTPLPEDFRASPEMVAWAQAETPLVGLAETERFRDYWRAVPGAKGRKTDWVATWRNWMRRAQDDEQARRARASPRERPAAHSRLWDQARQGVAT